MKLLLDANLSFRLIKSLNGLFSELQHVDTLFEERASDYEIWNYALEHNFLIATNDDDFMNILNVKGFPPKVILLRTGNQSNQFIANLITAKLNEIKTLSETNLYGILEIY